MDEILWIYVILLHIAIVVMTYFLRQEAKEDHNKNKHLISWMKSQEEINIALLNEIDSLKRENRLLKKIFLNQ